MNNKDNLLAFTKVKDEKSETQVQPEAKQEIQQVTQPTKEPEKREEQEVKVVIS
jgi:hypothetical protein